MTFVTAAVVLVLVADAGAWYQLGVRAHRAPSFARGGAFLSGAVVPPTTTTTAPGPAAAPTAPSPASTTVPAAAGPALPSAAASSYAPALPVRVVAGSSAEQLPAFGTYTWSVSGTETATGFGSRSLPATMTMVAHADDTGDPTRAVLDLTYSSDHQERLVLAAAGGGTGLDFEAGQVRFGPMAQANQGSYRPALPIAPAGLRAGLTASGTSQVLDANGNVERTEDWTFAVIGQEVVAVGRETVPAWHVHLTRASRPGSSQDVHRTRDLWWDPVRGLWVKSHDVLHGGQRYAGVTMTYDSDITATLASYRR